MSPAPRGLSLSTQVLIGLVLGIAAGVFFGELATRVDLLGRAFVRLLQMTVIPYVVVSLIAGVGQLDPAQARALALRGGAATLLLWSIAWTAVALFPLAFPKYETASFFSTAMVASPPQVDMLALYIPANPLSAMVEGIMPAIVLFSLCVGIALMALPNRRALVEQLSVLSDALMNLNAFVVRLAPFGVFALMASAAGTITLDELSRLQVFVITFAGMALLLALWVLPAFVAAVTPLRYREVLSTSRDVLVTAFATGSLLIVLPILASKSRRLSQPAGSPARDEVSPAEVIVPVSFNFPSTGKLLGLSFILFAGWFSGGGLELSRLPTLISVGTFTFFGPNAMAVPFMLDFFRLPSDLFEIFLTVDVLTGRFTAMLAAMHVLSVAVLTGFAVEGRLELSWPRLARWAAVAIAGSVVLLVGTRFYFASTLAAGSKTYEMFIEMELRSPPVTVRKEAPPLPRVPSRGPLVEIRESGVLQACYAADALPFAFVNEKSNLVGYDVDVMHTFARELGVDLYFRRIERQQMAAELDAGRCHLLIGGIAMTPERVEELTFTKPYLDNTLAFVTPDHARHAYATWEQIRAKKGLRLAIPDVPHYVTLMRQRLPEAEFVPVNTVREFFRGSMEVDALVFGAESGGAWTLVYPSFAVVVPKPKPIGIPVAYGVRRGEWEWSSVLDVWLDLRKRDGTLDGFYEHWILGRDVKHAGKRWSVIRNVLGWVD